MVVWIHEIYENIYLHFPRGNVASLLKPVDIQKNLGNDQRSMWRLKGDGGCKPSEKEHHLPKKKKWNENNGEQD